MLHELPEVQDGEVSLNRARQVRQPELAVVNALALPETSAVNATVNLVTQKVVSDILTEGFAVQTDSRFNHPSFLFHFLSGVPDPYQPQGHTNEAKGEAYVVLRGNLGLWIAELSVEQRLQDENPDWASVQLCARESKEELVHGIAAMRYRQVHLQRNESLSKPHIDIAQWVYSRRRDFETKLTDDEIRDLLNAVLDTTVDKHATEKLFAEKTDEASGAMHRSIFWNRDYRPDTSNAE